MVVLDERTWNYVHLNGTASLLWHALVDGASEPALIERLVEQFPDAEPTAAADVEHFIAELRTRGYLDES